LGWISAYPGAKEQMPDEQLSSPFGDKDKYRENQATIVWPNGVV
jgi:hypothetical protein